MKRRMMDQRLLLAERRLRNMRQPKRLNEIAVDEIVEAVEYSVSAFFEYFVELTDCNSRQQVLESLLSKRVQRGEINQLEARLNAILLFINQNTIIIDLTNLMTFCHPALRSHQISRVLELIAARATGIRSLTIGGEKSTRPAGRGQILEENAVLAICRLSKLQKLVIFDFKVQFSALRHICKCLPHLRWVDVDVASDLTSGIPFLDVDEFACSDQDFRRSFSRLRGFKFRTFLIMRSFVHLVSVDKFTERCIRLLPSLLIVESPANSRNMHGYRLPTEPPSAPSALRHLCVDIYAASPEQLARFPHVTHLRVRFYGYGYRTVPDEKLEALLRFPEIESLILVGCPSVEALHRFLYRYGPKLHTLSLHQLMRRNLRCQFKSIFDACPNLETLILDGVEMTDSQPLENFAQLKHLQWIDRTNSGNVRLANLLSAPALQNFSMSDAKVDLQDVWLLSTLIAEGKILRNLQTFKYITKCRVDMSIDVYCATLRELTKNAAAYLPQLVGLKTSLFSPKYFDFPPLLHASLCKNIGPFCKLFRYHEDQCKVFNIPQFSDSVDTL